MFINFSISKSANGEAVEKSKETLFSSPELNK
jgi:hypothetical protein